jgi:WhiB family redox-sensing transcriptional regulator
MFTATVPIPRGTSPEGAGAEGVGITGLLDNVPTESAELPCRVNDPDLWFAETPAELEKAKQLCADCPVRAECLAGALTRREPWGVWGGEIFERGAVIPRKRPRGRPRKEDRAREAQPAHESDPARQVNPSREGSAAAAGKQEAAA